MTFTAFMNRLLLVCGGIAMIGAAGAVIFKMISPAMSLKNRVNELDLKYNEMRSDLEDITKNTKILLTCTIALLNQSINDKKDPEYLKKTQDLLNEFLVQK